MASFEFRDLLNADNLWFRAACHGAVDDSLRPVKARVIRRLAADPESSSISQTVAAATGPTPEQFSSALVADPRWRTIVAESVARERRWTDLWRRRDEFKDAWDWTRAALEKIAGSGLPIGRTAALVASGTLSYVVTMNVLPKAATALDLELLPRMSGPTAVRFDGTMAPVSVSLSAPGPLNVPVNLVPEPDRLTVRARLDPADLEALARGNGRERVGNGQVRDLARKLDELARQAGETRDRLDTLNVALDGKLGALSDRAESIASQVRDGKAQTDLVRTDVDGLRHVAYRNVSPSLVSSPTIAKGASRTVDLAWMDDRGGQAECRVEFSVRRIARDVELALRPVGKCPAGVASALTVGPDTGPVPVGSWPFDVSLEGVRDRILRKPHALLRITRRGPKATADDPRRAATH